MVVPLKLQMPEVRGRSVESQQPAQATLQTWEAERCLHIGTRLVDFAFIDALDAADGSCIIT